MTTTTAFPRQYESFTIGDCPVCDRLTKVGIVRTADDDSHALADCKECNFDFDAIWMPEFMGVWLTNPRPVLIVVTD